MFAELLARDGVVERLELRSRFGFLAFHGGNLERMTAEIAAAAAAEAGASLYTVEQPADLRWHIPSRLVDPAASSAMTRFFSHVETGIAVHGYGRDGFWRSILIGGQNRTLASEVGALLRSHLPHYRPVDQLEDIPRQLRGQHRDNPVNRLRLRGVQLELPPRIRGMGPYWAGYRAAQDDADELVPHARHLVAALASAAVDWDTTNRLR